MKQIVYKCDITGYYLEYLYQDEIAYMYNISSDFTHIKPLIQLIRTSIDKLKEINIKKIVQTVSMEEWYNWINSETSFRIINNDLHLGICEICCDIEDFLENFGIIIGVNEANI